jgi:hypothetical protein
LSTTAYRVTAAVTFAGMLAGLLASILLGGCDHMLQCETGEIPMKCHWTYVATTAIFAAGLLVAAMQFALKTKEGRRVAAFSTALLALCATFLTTPWGIGLCAMEQMACHTTALFVDAVTTVVVVTALIQCIKASPALASKPKLDD